MRRLPSLLTLTFAALAVSGILRAADDDLERTVSMMARIGNANSPTFSPDGKTIAYVTNISGSPQVWTVDAAGGYPNQVTASDDPVGIVEWSPDGAWLAFSLAPGGGMNEQEYLVRPDGTGLKRLTDGGKETNQLGPWSRDGKLLVLGSNRRSADAVDSYVYDVASGSSRLVTQNRGIGAFEDLTADKKFALLNRLVNRGSNDLYLVEVATGKETLLTPHTGPGNFEGKFAKDGRAIYLGTDTGRDLPAFARQELSAAGVPGKTTILAERSDAELGTFELNDDGATAALLWNVGGKIDLELFDLRTGKSISHPATPAELVGGVEFTKDGKSICLFAFGSATPADIWVMDVATGTFRRVTRSPHAGVDLTKLIKPELVRFKAHDGLDLSGWLYKPIGSTAGTAPFPTVLSFHGGPEGQERPSFSSTYQALLSRGIAVFAPNVRGSAGFGKKFVNLDNGALRFEGVKDIKDCVDAAVKSGVADPRRIGIMGGSYGGYMVMAGLTEYPELFAAGADLYGVVNFETFFKNTEPWMAAISKIEYGDPDKEADLLRRLSPIHKVDRVTAPTIVLHGANDTNVPVVEAEQVVESLKKRGIPVEYVLFPDEGHGWRKTPNRIRSAVAMTKWFEKYLKAGG
ncbi:MAG: S9 family peptidase [Acidobacteriota bacterium]